MMSSNRENKVIGGVQQPSEEQAKQIYDNLPAEKKKKSYAQWLQETYQNGKEKWVPWIEDLYLKWFGKDDNKASYVTKDKLNKTKVTGVTQVDQLQDDVHNLVGNQVGDKGLLAPVGNLASKEGINRAERGGKDEDGKYGGPASSVTDPVVKNVKGGGQSVGSSATSGAKSAGSYMGIGSSGNK